MFERPWWWWLLALVAGGYLTTSVLKDVLVILYLEV